MSDTPTYATLAEALAAFQATRPKLEKTNTATVTPRDNPASRYSYQYADLADVEETVLPLLGAVGLAWTCNTELAAGSFVLVCSLVHGASGEIRSSVFPLPGAGNPQALGSALTYFKRYALMMATGVSAAGEDDDGQRAQHSAQRRDEPRRQPQDRPDPGPGTRQGSADDAARAITRVGVAGLPELWERVTALGVAANKLSPRTAQALSDYLAAQDLPPETIPGQMAPHLVQGSLRALAAFVLARAASEALNEHEAHEVLSAYTAMVRTDQQFAAVRIPGGDTLGDYITLAAAALGAGDREANSDPERNPTPPWESDAGATGYDADDAEQHWAGGDDTEGHPGDNRAAVLEGT